MASRRLARLLAVLGVVLVGEVLARALVVAPSRPYHEYRLGPVFALARGYRLLPPPGEGPVIGFFYGPVAALAYLPVTLTPGPVAALLAAELLTAAYLLGPVVVLHALAARRDPRARVPHRLGLLAFGFYALGSPTLGYNLVSPVHDGVALGLAMACCVVLGYRDAPPGLGSGAAAAVLLALAVWSKQNAVFFVPGVLVYLALAFGWGTAFRFLGGLAAVGVVVSAAVAAAFGVRGIRFNLFDVVRGNPLLGAPLSTTRVALEVMAPLLAAGAFAALCRRPSLRPAGLRALTAGGRVVLLLTLVAASALPGAVLGMMKYGGGPNSLGFSLVFLTAAVTFALAETVRSLRAGARRVARHALTAGVLGLALTATLQLWADLRRAAPPWRLPTAQAYRFARAHPGEAYFPWNPVATSYAGERVWTTEEGPFWAGLSGINTPEPVLRATLPANPRYVAYPPGYFEAVMDLEWRYMIRIFYKDHTRRVDVPGLPGWSVYAREGGPSHPEPGRP